MSYNFSGIPVTTLQQTVARYPVALPQGFVVPPNQVPPSCVPVLVNWNIYWQLLSNPSNLGVSVNLQAQSTQATVLDRIASVKIDNTGSSNPVYIYFPDTQDVVSCPPNCSVTLPTITNGLNAIIYIEGLLTGNIPTTKVYFYNFVQPPSIDPEINNAVALWKSSPNISRGSTIFNTKYGTPALGDQLYTLNISLGAVGLVAENLFNTPYNSGTLILTNLFVSLVGVTTQNGTGSLGVVIESTGSAGELTPFGLTVSGGGSGGAFSGNFFPVVQLTNCNIELDATQMYQLRVFSQSGNMTAFCAVQAAFTQQS